MAWTPEQVLQLHELAGKVPLSEIASQLERTEGAVESKALREGLSLDVGARGGFGYKTDVRKARREEKKLEVYQARLQGLTWAEVVAKTGVSQTTALNLYRDVVAELKLRREQFIDELVDAEATALLSLRSAYWKSAPPGRQP